MNIVRESKRKEGLIRFGEYEIKNLINFECGLKILNLTGLLAV